MYLKFHISTNQELLKSNPVIKVAAMKTTDDFCYAKKPSHAITTATLFTVSKDGYDIKEDIGKSLKNALYILRYAKRHLSG